TGSPKSATFCRRTAAAAGAAPAANAARVTSTHRIAKGTRTAIGTGDIPLLLAQLRDQALGRALVLPPAEELGAVAYAVAGDVVEGDLAYELGAQPLPHELLVGLPSARLAGAPLVGAVGLEQLEQLALLLRAEARGVAHDVERAVVVVETEDQRADRPWLLPEAERHHDRVRGA